MHFPGLPFARHIVLMFFFLYMSDARPSYYISTPSYIFPGVNTTLAVHLFGTNYSELNVTAGIMEKRNVLVQTSNVFHNDSIGMLTIPALPANASSVFYDLFVNGSAQDKLVFSKQIALQMQIRNVSVFIQTDKIAYKPGQPVKIRVISVYSDLRPYKGHVDLTFMDAENNIVQKWLNLSTDLGVVSTEFLLSGSPMLGSWRIQAAVDKTDTTAYFTVDDHVLPRFDVTINAPASYLLSSQLNLTGTVTAKNNFGKPIKGNVTVSLNPMYYVPSGDFTKTYVLESGSANFSFTYEEIVTLLNWGAINITASVTEEQTGIVMGASSYTETTNSEYRLFILGDPRAISPGLNFTAKMQIVRVDNTSLAKEERDSNVTIKIVQSTTSYWWFRSSIEEDNLNSSTPGFSSDTVIVQQYAIPESGFIVIEFPLIQSVQLIRIEAQYRNTTKNWLLDRSSGKNMYAQIRVSSGMKRVGEAFQVDVNTSPQVQDLYYVVMAKGIIVAAGKKTNSSFTLTPEQSWAPSATLKVYFLYINSDYGQIVETSKTLYIKGAFRNKASLSWSKNKAQPEENLFLTVNAVESRSLVGLRIVEKTAQENGNDLTEIRVENEITAYTQGIGYSISDSIISQSDSPLDELIPLVRGEEDFIQPLQPVKTLYPETWIWLETNISSTASSSLQLTAPKTNSTWVASAFVISEGLGLGLTEPTELEVFQPFFILLNMPYSVTRGEQLIVEVIVFNYLAENLQVTVELDASNTFEFIVINDDVNTLVGRMNVTVPTQGMNTVLFPIKPRQLGQISITVRATSSKAADIETKTLFVKAEGIKQFHSEAVLFQLDGTGSSPQTVSKNLSFTFPTNVVQGSEEAFVTVVGDLLGPSIEGLESLIQMPYGCGEQNMINFAPNIYVLQYLIATLQITQSIRTQAISFMEIGYQKELTYRRNDGSFSAFGNNDASGSTWLSAFVLRCFLQARPFIYISPDILTQTVEWLVQYQDMNTGVFSEPGRVIHSELQGGLNGPITLTAYILTSLIEDEGYRNQHSSRVLKAVQYLENEFDKGISSNYTLSVVVYALSLANSTKANTALTQLNSRANTIGGLKYWSSPSALTSYWQPPSSDIETAAYALLSHYRQNRISEGIPIMRWLSQQRNHLGGYSSTQDTVMALQALAQFMSVASTGETSLTVTVTGPGSFVPKIFPIDSANLLVLQSQQISVSQPLSISVTAAGRGLAIFQLNIVYNQRMSSKRKSRGLSSEAFTLDVTVNEDKNNIQRYSVDVCTSYQGSGNESGMALLDVGYLSGFTLDPDGIPIRGPLKMVEKSNDKVYLYYDSVTKTSLCVSVPMVRVANVAGSKDAVVKIVDYYNPRDTAIRTYNSETMRKISTCDFCGLNCTLCQSNVRVVKPQTSSGCSPTFHLFGLFIFSMYFIMWQ
ncbi:CD109 antigen-like [Spea bombifrons]|uniref:CD109 antigen-like n=1 Tax=Spea bombifrons TaxID=233779 RepID=UPI00234A776B|nr:CD109 antigen-like [Spea bombifrons]